MKRWSDRNLKQAEYAEPKSAPKSFKKTHPKKRELVADTDCTCQWPPESVIF